MARLNGFYEVPKIVQFGAVFESRSVCTEFLITILY